MEIIQNNYATRPLCSCFFIIICTSLISGCGSMRETFPDRSATEQLLMSTAADRALETLPPGLCKNKAVFIKESFMNGYDDDYVILGLRRQLLNNGARLANSADKSDITIAVSTGALSIDYRSGLIGLPSIPIPLPFATEPLQTPELPLFKNVTYKGLAKILLTCYKTENGELVSAIPILRGKAIIRHRWYLLMGPFRTSDLNEEFE